MGKVHGSLARAGKVKSQTPKVEPQGAKGRAMKRLKYTRRFVNVQLTGGKRKVRTSRPTDGSITDGLRAIVSVLMQVWLTQDEQMNPNPTS
ncbi:ribosomal protein S30A [Gnomoniopsis sp. IMI 355080]|nr:ribosomal protein S30A [Gnomoniopsis sp. IMI 355080]